VFNGRRFNEEIQPLVAKFIRRVDPDFPES
jgi:poly-beta-hydroxyalkanoate depolymerase